MEENNQNKVETSGGAVGSFEKVMELIGKYGPLRIIYGLVIFVFFSFMVYIATNPSMVFDRYSQYIAEKHNASVEYRMETAPLIRAQLNQLALETGAERAYVLEFHNGKSNPSGLQWQFGDLTFINDGTEDISDEIQNASLSKYAFANVVYDNGHWIGSIDELEPIDERFYNRMVVNHGTYFAFQIIYGSNMREIGILGITYIEKPDNITKNFIMKEISKYAATLSPLLDEQNVKVKKK